jgi:hypothetical protein
MGQSWRGFLKHARNEGSEDEFAIYDLRFTRLARPLTFHVSGFIPRPMTATNLSLTPTAAPATNGLHEIKPPIDIPSGLAWIAWTLAALALASVLFCAWRYWRRKLAETPLIPIIPPHIRAKQKLQEALAFLDKPREFCILVSDTARWYLEERFDFRAPERTTEEFLYELQATSLLTADQKASLGEFLQSCDLVKFAKYEPGEPELRALHASALRLVEETEPVPAASDGDQSSKPQAPSSREETSSEDQKAPRAVSLDRQDMNGALNSLTMLMVWSLGFEVSLVLGAWSLEFS